MRAGHITEVSYARVNILGYKLSCYGDKRNSRKLRRRKEKQNWTAGLKQVIADDLYEAIQLNEMMEGDYGY